MRRSVGAELKVGLLLPQQLPVVAEPQDEDRRQQGWGAPSRTQPPAEG